MVSSHGLELSLGMAETRSDQLKKQGIYVQSQNSTPAVDSCFYMITLDRKISTNAVPSMASKVLTHCTQCFLLVI